MITDFLPGILPILLFFQDGKATKIKIRFERYIVEFILDNLIGGVNNNEIIYKG